jgi:predicted RNA polymerase sigma factor
LVRAFPLGEELENLVEVPSGQSVHGVRAALAELDRLESELEKYPLFHATRSQLLRADGRPAEADETDQRTSNPAQLELLHERLAGYD